jgi:hypothetical protein
METQQQFLSLATSTKNRIEEQVKNLNSKIKLTIVTVLMKKMDNSGTTAGPAALLNQSLSHHSIAASGDSNNNVENSNNGSNLNEKSSNVSKSETQISEKGKKPFYKLIFKSSSGSNNNHHNNDTNNNSSSNQPQQLAPASNNSYTKVSMERTNGSLERKISLLTVDSNHQSPPQQQGNSLLMSQADLVRR